MHQVPQGDLIPKKKRNVAEAAIKKMLATPHKPHATKGKKKPSPGKGKAKKRR